MVSLSARVAATCSCTTPRSVATASGPWKRVRRSSSRSSTVQRVRRQGTSAKPRTTNNDLARRRQHTKGTSPRRSGRQRRRAVFVYALANALQRTRRKVYLPILHRHAKRDLRAALFLESGHLRLDQIGELVERH